MIKKLIKNMTVKSRIVLVLVVVVTAATVAVALVRATQVADQMDTLLEERLKGNANMTFGIFDTVGTYTWWTLNAIASHAERGLTDEDYDIDWQIGNLFNSMSHELDGVRFYENIAVFDSEFNLVAAGNPYGHIPDVLLFPEYFNEQLAGQWISPVYECPVSGRLQFLFTQPIMYEGDLLGMAALTGNTEMLAYFLRDFVQLYDSFVNLADRSGVIFFSNRPEAYMGRHVNDLGVIEAFGEIPMNTVFEHHSALTGIDKIAYVTFDPGLNWTIVSFFDAHAVESTAQLIFESLRFTVGGILLAAALIVIIVHQSLKPLQTLAESAKEVAKGNLEVNFDVSRNDEISQVAQSFMAIVNSLKTLQENFTKAENAMTGDSQLGGVYDEMQRLKFEAESASKAKSDFLSKMSHEIRTPMNAILGMSELILREDISDSVREQAVTIKQSGDHLLSIINDILDLSKVESGKLEIINSEYLLHSTIHDVISIVKMRMHSPELRFAVYMEHDIPNDLIGDEVRIRQVLINVLTNAVKYTQRGYVSFDITAERDGDETLILTMKIKDTGIGIKKDDLELLFGEYNQFDLEANKNIEGTGLGLAITNNLVNLMGGSIEVSSKYGFGSEFTIILPQKLPSHEDDPEYGKWPPHFENKRILLYCRTPVYSEYASRSLWDLKTEHHVLYDDSELQSKLLEGDWDYVFAEGDLARTANNIVTANALSTKVVMMSDSYDARGSEEHSLLVMPVYLLSIVNVLGGGEASHTLASRHIEMFTAPDARILLVDDIETNLKVGAGLLAAYGVTVDCFLSGKEAINALKVQDYDLVLMDHMMPEMDGVETVGIIRSLADSLGDKYANLPIIALTANAIVGAKDMFLRNGFNDFLPKPIEISKLSGILSKWITKEKQLKADSSLTAPTIPEKDIGIIIDGVDTARGMSLSGGSTKGYIDVLSTFSNNGRTKIDELLKCIEQGNFKLYTTYVHALKSASANVGANKISGEAAILEEASISHDVDFIKKNNGNFISSLKELLDNIDAVINANTEKSDDGKVFDEDELNEELSALSAALKAFDAMAIDEIGERLSAFTGHPSKGELLKDILQNILIGKSRQAAEQIDNLLGDKFGNN